MPFFKYRAKDASGTLVSGSLDAVDATTAAARLAKMGLREIAFDGDAPATPPGPRAPALPRPTPPRPTPPRPTTPRPAASPSHPPRSAVATTPRPAAPVTTPPAPTAQAPTPVRERPDPPVPAEAPDSLCPFAPPKERAFFFDQLGRFLNSGVAPARALETLGDQARGRVQAHLHAASRRAAGGMGLGESLRGGYVTEPERDAITAAERGGYVPEACARLGEIAMDAHRLGRGFAYPIAMMGLAFAAAPLTRATQDGAMRSMELQDAAGGTLPTGGTIAREVGVRLPAMTVVALAILAALALLWRVWMLPAFREARHRLAATVPPLAGRAKGEAVAQLAYHLAGLSRAGIAAHESARLAAATAPNLALRAELVRGMGSLAVGAPLSRGLASTSLVDPTLRHMVENGETTGDLPGALSMIARVEHAETGRRSMLAGKTIFLLLNLFAALVTAFVVATGASYWYTNIIRMFTKGD